MQYLQRKVRSGFTIPEMLAVIAILTLIISLLLPTLSKARDQARLVKCQSNLRQTAIANRGYALDHTGWYVYNTYGGGKHQGVNYTKYWATDPEFLQYLGLKIENVSNKWKNNPGQYGAGFQAGCQWPDEFDCPSQGQPKYWVQNDYWGHEMGIAYNREKNDGTLRVGVVASPSAKFQFADGENWWMSSKYSNYKIMFDLKLIDNGGWGGILPRHQQGDRDTVNVAFYDAHVENLPKEETYFYGTGAADKIARRWNLEY